MRAFVGGYTDRVTCLEKIDGRLEIRYETQVGDSPSFLLIAGDVLYCAHELKDKSRISAWRIGEDRLEFLNGVQPAGSELCQLCKGEQTLYGACYGSGHLIGVHLQPEGSLGELITPLQHHGSSADPERQTGPHCHSANLTPDGRVLIAADLGIDKLLFYEVQKNGALLPEREFVELPAGEGPRHLAFSPDGKLVAVITEMGNQIFIYRLEGDRLIWQQVLPSISMAFEGHNQAADIHFSPEGRHLYASNRGENSIALFQVSDGRVRVDAHYSCGGDWPRQFTLDRLGEQLLVANQRSDNVSVLRRDVETGELSEPIQQIAIEKPSCVAIYGR